MTAPAHLNWLVNTGNAITSVDGQTVELWELNHAVDAAILSAWAKHFREHYCDDAMLPDLANGMGLSHSEYLTQIKFPDPAMAPGPSVRSGDFAEIIVADYIEYKLGYWCPRQLRYDFKWNRNESTKGCDVVGFKFAQDGVVSPQDELFVFEAKAQLALGAEPQNRLQIAIDDSNKDKLREAMTLNALRQRFLERGERVPADKIARFQNETDRPFKRVSGAAAVHDVTTFDPAHAAAVTATGHFNASNLRLIVVTGTAMMQLVHALYRRAADEA
ncbi:Hachiman antiphage defense system protein HamA [Bradyrhizobium sp. McL0616]|uniref:Hachiman antiphage defense system protein HamA n=1 Tax=Bradyrhizobium sp. McL0616 TaxID=3415674 RepID=UPI003CEBFD83